MAGWEAALPERTKLSPLTTAMYGLDGTPRITHIWPFPDLNERLAMRQKSFDCGIWPPRGRPREHRPRHFHHRLPHHLLPHCPNGPCTRAGSLTVATA